MTKAQLLKFIKKNKIDIQKARASFFLINLVFQGYAQSKSTGKNILSPCFSFARTFDTKKVFYQFILEDNIFKLADKVYRFFLKNSKNIKNKARQRKLLMKKIDDAWLNYNQNKKGKITSQFLINAYKRILSLSNAYWGYSAIVGEDKGVIVDKVIIPGFAKRHRISESQAREIISVLTHPQEQSILNKERLDFLKINLYVVKNKIKPNLIVDKKLEKIISGYIKNNFWIKTDFHKATKITQESLLKEIEVDLKNKKESQIKKEIKAIDANFRNIVNKKKKLLKKIKLSKVDKKDLEFTRFIIVWQDERKEETMKQIYYLYNIIRDVATFTGNSYQSLMASNPEEIIEIIKNNRNIRKKPIDYFIVFEKGRKIKNFIGRDAKELLEAVLATQQETEIKGIVACQGRKKTIQGVVRIINNPSVQNFNNGEILVTSMTRVEFVPLMHKAKAIITDEGGIACHAAIVSRELGVSCVVGTKIATKVLKDGDLIEVDTEKGSVKIIKQNQ